MKLEFLVLMIVALLAWRPTAQAQCGGAGTPAAFGASEYLYCGTDASWGAADADCAAVAAGWTLTRVEDSGENGFVRGLGGGNLWLGGDDQAIDGQWLWRDGDQFWLGDDTGMPVGGLYNNWSGGQPNAGADEDCARMKGDSTWEDRKCTDIERYVCEGPPFCGSSARGAGEECDDGNTVDGDGCSATCTLEAPAPCGDGLIWLGEECDDGGTAGGDGCNSNCEIEPGYTCTGEPSICTSSCADNFEWRSQMGSTTTEYFLCEKSLSVSAAETICEGLAGGWTLTRINGATENAYIDGFIGNHLWTGGHDEAVEGVWRWRDGTQFWSGDENGSPVGGLYTNWKSGEPNAGADEDCTRQEDGGLWQDKKCTDNEKFVCEGPPICGNGAVAMPEECDDGNTADGDGCSATCTLEGAATCGDGRVWLGEECDDGNALGGDGCSAICGIEPGFTCTGDPSSTCTAICVPGDLQWHSQMGATTTEYLLCDTSHTASNAETICEGVGSGWTLARIDDATENAYLDGFIGNHLWTGGQDEAVEGVWRWRDGVQFWQGDETGNPVGGLYTNWKSGEPNAGADEDCLRQENGGLWQDRKCTDKEKFVCEGPPICGNGAVATPEECDDGNIQDGDGCSATCALEAPPPCGDGRIWLGEQCDDGNPVGGDGCSSTCQVEPGYTCTGDPTSTCTPFCADNFEWHSQMGATTTEYLLCEKALTASEAETICEGLGAGWTLARVDDATENGYLDGFIGNHVWIGGQDQTVEGEWRWRDGDQFWQGDETGNPVGGLYTNWKSGEPNAGADEDCLRQENGGLWQDRKCSDDEKFVCEGPSICGNGAVAMPEGCDDGNTANGDGCSSDCTVESGYECFLPDDAGTPSICQLSTHVLVGRVELLRVRGETLLQWETTSQSGTLGFVVSRRDSDEWEPVHEGILLALPGAPQGGVYTLRDRGASTRQRVSYRIEEIEIDGARKPIGEWALLARPATAPGVPQTDYDAEPRALAARSAQRAEGLVLKSHSSGPASRVVLDVARDGAVEVSITDLSELLATSPAEIRDWAESGNVKISEQAHQVPWWFDEASDSLVIVGRSSTSVYSATRKYVVRNASGRPMPVEPRQTEVTAVGTGTTRHQLDSNAFPALVVSPDPESDYWFAASLSARAPGYGHYETEIGLPEVPIEAATLRVYLYGGWNLNEETAQRVTIHVNGAPVDTVQVAALGPHVFEMSVDPGVLNGGTNQLLLVADSDVPAAASGLYVDRFELDIERALSTSQPELEFTALRTGALTVEVAAASAHVLDITAQKKIEATLVADPELGTTSVSFEAVSDHRYLVFEAPSQPLGVRGAVELEAPSNGASYLVITPAAWVSAAERFAALHAAEGLSTAVVSIESLYDAYGHSVATPHAIHDFLVDAEAQWADKPRFVLLLGDGTLDYRNLMGIGPGAIAPRMTQTKAGLYASDALLGDLDEDGLADVAIGRIPAQTVDEAVAAFEALQRYQALEFSDFGLSALMISGANRGTNFAEPIDALLKWFPPELETRSIGVDALGAERARAELAIDLQRAPYWMHYTGHGGLDRFDDEGVLMSQDIPMLRPLLPPIVTGMTCSTSRFELPGIDALAEHMVDPANEFAIASWGASGVTMSHYAAKLGEAFATKLFNADGGAPRLGDLVVALHQEHAPAYDAKALAVYVLLGDPALRLKTPPAGITVAPPVDSDPEVTTPPTAGSETASPASAAGCAVQFGRDSTSLYWLVLACLWLGRRRRVA
ncbi:MAG: C25 family cysteine peptidase [Myxococcales bacterium]|nr:C25 family cysteine peptidase [Myxococcales bacterium]